MSEFNSDPYEIRILSLQVPEESNSSTLDSKARGGSSYENRFHQDLAQGMEQQQLGRLTESTVPAQSFQSELSGFLKTMDQAFLQAQTEASQNSGLELSEVELTVGIDGRGKFMLLGWGVEAGTKGSIRLLFKRSARSDG